MLSRARLKKEGREKNSVSTLSAHSTLVRKRTTRESAHYSHLEHVDDVPARDAARAQRRGLAHGAVRAHVVRAVERDGDGGGFARVAHAFRRHRLSQLREGANLGDLYPLGAVLARHAHADLDAHPYLAEHDAHEGRDAGRDSRACCVGRCEFAIKLRRRHPVTED
jgi:hypothetical protein